MKYLSSIMLCLLLLAGCGRSNKQQTVFNPTISVEIEVIGSVETANVRNYVGTVQPEMKLDLAFPLGGTLQGLYVSNGQKVRRGDLIAKVDDTSAKSLHDAAVATLNQAEDGYRRLKQVYDEGGVSEVRWVQMETDLEKARQAEISTRKHLQECTMYASQNGIISMDNHFVGEQLMPGQTLCHIVDLNHLIVEFSVPEKEIYLIDVGDKAKADIPALNSQENTIVIYDKSLLSNPLGHSYTIKAKLESDEKDLLPGMVTKIKLSLNSETSASVVIPSSCVQTMPEGSTVWVIRDGKSYRQTIEVSDFVKNGVLVSNGLNEGDTIVSVGYQKLYNGAKVTF